MTRSCRLALSGWLCTALLMSLSACADQPLVAPAHRTLSFTRQGDGCRASDPEVFGNIYLNGVASQRTDVTITIDAADAETRSRLKDAFPQSMWVSPNISGYPLYPVNRGFGWYDPRAGCECGGLDGYLSADTASRAREVHWQSATQPYDSTSPERHCIVPGHYHVAINGPQDNQGFDFEYVGVRAAFAGSPSFLFVLDPDLGDSLLIEPREYTPYDSYSDHTLNFDLASPRSHSAQAVLRLQTIYSDPDASPFAPEQGQPAITDRTYVRFSMRQRSGFGWPGNSSTTDPCLSNATLVLYEA